MKKYVITIVTQLETFNIIGVTEKVLYFVIKAYYNEEDTLKLGGKTYSLKRIQEFVIHEFDSEEKIDEFIKYVSENKSKKVGLTGTEYIDVELINEFGTNVTLDYLTIDRDEVVGNNEGYEKLSEENKEILDGINELIDRLSKLEMGQEIIYDDLKKDLEEVKDFIGKASKKTIRQLVIGKLVDAGLGAVASYALEAIKDSGVLKIG